VQPRDLGVQPKDLDVTSKDLCVTSKDLGTQLKDLGVTSKDLGVTSKDLGVQPRDLALGDHVAERLIDPHLASAGDANETLDVDRRGADVERGAEEVEEQRAAGVVVLALRVRGAGGVEAAGERGREARRECHRRCSLSTVARCFWPGGRAELATTTARA
jgi:hypothetical protein